MVTQLPLIRRRESPQDLIGHFPMLDGIRGIAVLQVFVAHLHHIVSPDPFFNKVTPWHWLNKTLEPGSLGVDIFFVLSGFLITSLLLKDDQRQRPVQLRHFYIRRALRLLPALYAILIFDYFIALWEKFPMNIQWRTTWNALLYLNNWSVVWHPMGLQNDLGHLWSLGIEEQFYIVWPVILILMLSLKVPQKIIMSLVTIAIAIVVWHRNDLWVQGVSWLDLYVRTDTRVDSLLVGALFAFGYRHYRVNTKFLSWIASMCFFGIVCIKYNYGDAFRNQGGLTLVALLAGVVIWAAVENCWGGNRVLTWRPLMLLGKVSYGLYLWHFPIFLVVCRHFSSGPQSFRILIGVVISLAATAMSWFCIERPFLNLKDRRFSSTSSEVS